MQRGSNQALIPRTQCKRKSFFFLFKVIISQHSPVRSSFQTCRHNKPNFFFPSFSQVCNQSVSSFFFIFSSKDNYNTGRAALQTQIQKGTHMSNTQTDTFRQNTHTNRPCICMYWTILEGDSEIEKDAPLAGKQKSDRKDISVRVCKIFLQRENNYTVNLKEKHSLSRQTLK